MPIPIKQLPPGATILGAAAFSSRSRYISAIARDDNRLKRPIEIHMSSEEQDNWIIFSLDEAEALIACLTHAVALRRQADTAKAA